MKLKGKAVFISGPMTGIEDHNVGEFAKAHARLKEAGASHIFDPAVNYLTQEFLADDLRHEDYMRTCIAELVSAFHYSCGASDIFGGYDLLVQLPGWQDSEGARTERDVAEACGIEVRELAEVLGG